MRYMGVDEIRQRFLGFFTSHDHQQVLPSGILPVNDPTLLFINSGMAPMKPYFLGAIQPPYPRLTNVQDCIRTVDIDDAGDSYHGSSFRMMGSWSFGDYFKAKAIELAFTLITEGFGFPAERLYATVMKDDPGLPGIPPDEESARIWEQFLPTDRIVWCPPADNFWGPAGDSGPCGPCTEVFYDRGDDYGDPNSTDTLVRERHIEIWNAGVFMQYEKTPEGEIVPLRMRCVDTGAGLERFAMLLQCAPSIHQIDQYARPFAEIKGMVSDIRSSRIILDHTKTCLLMLAEGVSPGNQRREYVLRRLLRRVLTLLYLRSVELREVLSILTCLAPTMDQGTSISQVMPSIIRVVESEVSGFAKMLGRAEKHLARIADAGAISADQAFQLKATHGIPDELVREYCRENGIDFPEAGFVSLLEQHRAISR